MFNLAERIKKLQPSSFFVLIPISPHREKAISYHPSDFTVKRCQPKREDKMKITEDVRKYAAELGIAEEEALKKVMEAKSKEFLEKGAEVYAKA